MQCKICGTDLHRDGVEYRPRSGMILCKGCHRTTPAKVTRAEFDAEYWDGCDNVPESTKREFYDDYRSSTYGAVADYIKATTSDVL